MTDLVTTLQQKRYKILLIGDTCIDHYIYGSVERISPEAPIPVLKLNGKEEFRGGMSYNVYNNLKSLHCDVTHLKGGDSKKIRYIDQKSGYQLLRVDEDIKETPIKNISIHKLNNFDAVVVSDYNKGLITYETVKYIRDFYRGPIFIDSKKTDLYQFQQCYVKINQHEYDNATSYPDKKHLIVTRSSEGTYYDGVLYPTEKVEVHDVTGAGDVYLASLTVFYLMSFSIEKSIPFANALASKSVQHHGVYTIQKEDINELTYHGI